MTEQLQCHSCSEKFTPKGDWWEKQDGGWNFCSYDCFDYERMNQ